MRVLFDTDVLMDALAARQPFGPTAIAALDLCRKGSADGYVAGHAVTTLYYLLRKQLGSSRSLTAIAQLLSVLAVAPITGDVLNRALASGFGDFEDGVTHSAALEVQADRIVTRNDEDFGAATVPIVSPAAFVATKTIQ